MMEMYLAGVSVRRVEDITQSLWGMKVSPSTVSELNQKIYVQIEKWRMKPIEGKHPYVYLDGLWLKRRWGGEAKNVSVLVAIGSMKRATVKFLVWLKEPRKVNRAGVTFFAISRSVV